MITDKQEALEAIKIRKVRLRDISKEIITQEMALEAISQYGNSEYSYAIEINVPGVSSGEFRKKAREIVSQRNTLSKNTEHSIYRAKSQRTVQMGRFSPLEVPEIDEFREFEEFNEGVEFQIGEEDDGFELSESPEDDGFELFESPEDDGFELFESPEDDGFELFESPEDDGFELFESPEIDDFDAPDQPDTMQPYSTATLGDEVSMQEGEREELTLKLMEQIELSYKKGKEITKLDSAIQGLENLEKQYAIELKPCKGEGKVF